MIDVSRFKPPADGDQWEVEVTGSGPSRLLVHVPHGGTAIPDEVAQSFAPGVDIDDELRQMTDWHTGDLARAALLEVPAIAFVNNVSRLVVDPERFPDDNDEMMSKVGMGAVYERTSHRKVLRTVTPELRSRYLERWYEPYATAFAGVAAAVLDEMGELVIVDLHSYPSVLLPYELDPSAARPGVCIGTDDFHTPEWLASAVEAEFTDTARNAPFAGTYVPLAYHRREQRVTSVMVEIRRDLYQVEPGGPLHGASHVVDCLRHLFASIATAPGS